MKDLAPHITRQRMVVEGIYGEVELSDKFIRLYLLRLSGLLKMTVIYGPLIMQEAGKIYPQHAGFEGVMIWAESGVNIYTWEDGKFFTVDLYSCKAFSSAVVVDFTTKYFKVKDITFKEV